MLSVIFAVSMVVLLGVGILVVRHLVLPNLDRWQPQIEQLISRRVGLPVQIQGLSGEFEGFSPSVKVQSLRIGAPDAEPALLAQELQAVLSWRTILSGRPNFEFLTGRKLALQITRIAERRLIVAGLPVQLPEMDQVHPDAPNAPWQLPDWLLRQQSVAFPAIDLHYRDRDSGEQASVRGLQVHSSGSATERRIQMVLPAVADLSGTGLLHATLTRPSLTAPTTTIRRWQGEAYAEIDAVELPRLARLLRLPPALVAGTAATKARFTVVDSKPSDARLVVDGQNWQVSADQPDERLQSVQVQIDADWRSNGNVDLTLRDAQATDQTGAVIALDDKTQMLTLRPDLRPARARFSLRAFDAARLLSMARTLPLPDGFMEKLDKLSLSGVVDAIDVDFDARSGSVRYRLDADFTELDLGFGPARNLKQALQTFSPRPPWFERLSGRLEMTETGGTVRVASATSAVGLPGIFAEPRIPLNKLDADVAWTIDPVLSAPDRASDESDPGLSGLTVRINRLRLENTDATADIAGVWRGAGKSRRGSIDLQASVKRAKIARVYRYVPTELPPDVRRWLRTALQGGIADEIRFTLQGDLADFPFRKPRPGQFLIEASIRDGQLKYLPDFPPVTDWQGSFRLERAGLQARARSGRIFNSMISDLQISIAEVDHAVLKLEGAIKGSAQEAIHFVNTSPIGERIDGFLRQAKASGEASTRMSMSIPLKTPDQGTVTGRTTLAGSQVFLTDFLPRFSGVSGELVYGTAGFATTGLKLSMLGGPATVEATTPEKGRLELAIKGRASAAGIRSEIDSPITANLQGEAGYRATIIVAQPGVSMNIDSDMVGMAMQLPEPLRKAAGTRLALAITSRPVRLAGRAPARWGDRLAVKLGKDFVAMFERDPEADGQGGQRLAVRRGVIAFDSIPAIPDEGLSLALNTVNLNVDRWLSVLQIVPEPGAEPAPASARSAVPEAGYFRGFDLEPVRANLISAALIYSNKRFTDVVLGANRTGHVWAANITTNQVDGYVNWVGQGRDASSQPLLSGKFQRLEIPDTRTTEFDGLLNTPPASLPALDIEAEHFVLAGKQLGRLQLKASNRADGSGWEISSLVLDHPSARFDGTGLWTRASAAAQQTNLTFTLVLHDAGQLLAVLGQPDTMREGSGKLSGRLGWRGAPVEIDIPTLEGELALALGPGQFLRTEPGIAKLVGVLSLQSIPRRLTLDFSDVFAAGFAFDTVVGQARVANGTLTTDNLLMNGVQAQVLIAGNADLLAETQALQVQVLPTINAGLASIAYAAVANPAIGIGTLIAQLLLQDPLRKLFRYEFEIEGSWAEPKVTQTRPNDAQNPADEIYGPH